MEPTPSSAEPEPDEPDNLPELHNPLPAPRGLMNLLRDTNHNDGIVSFIRRTRRMLPGDPDFGDPLSMSGDGGPRAAARAADRLLADRDAASREVGLAGLQVWQALSERIKGRPSNPEMTIVFTDLVGFSDWSLSAGDEATLTLLRRVAAAVEPPVLDRGGHIVKRMGDGMMAVFRAPDIAIAAVLVAQEALATVEVDGHTPSMRVGLHSGRPQRIGSDWVGVDVNIAARVMERAVKGGIVASGDTLDLIGPERLDALGVTAKRVRKPMFASRPSGVPPELQMYWIKTRRELTADIEADIE